MAVAWKRRASLDASLPPSASEEGRKSDAANGKRPQAVQGQNSFSDQAKALYVSAANKGGMDGIDTEKIAQIQLETASSSTFTGHQKQLNAAVDERVRRLTEAQARLDEPQRQAARAAVCRRTGELESQRNLNRVCMVVDFDMFYAAVAIRDDPSLAEMPLAVGSQHGIVLTANYVARRWGVRSGMPGFVAKELGRRGPEFGMPKIDLRFVPPDYAKYAEIADVAMEIYREYDPRPSMGMGYDECSLE